MFRTRLFFYILFLFYITENGQSQNIQQYVLHTSDLNPSLKKLPKNWVDDLMFKMNSIPKNITKPFLSSKNYSNILNRESEYDESFHKSLSKNFSSNIYESCIDPSYQDLSSLFNKFSIEKWNIIEFMMLTPNQSHKYPFSISSSNYENNSPIYLGVLRNTRVANEYSKKKQNRCDSNSKETLNIVEKGQERLQQRMPLCPWYYKTISRFDRFPFSRIVAFCNCKNCVNHEKIENIMKNDFQFKNSKCMAIRWPMPVLVRGKCNKITGIYNWYEAIEDVSVGCVCGWI